MKKRNAPGISRVEQQVLNYLKRQDPDDIALHFARQRSRMVANYYLYALKADRIYRLVCELTGQAGVAPPARRLYYSFALELEKLYRTRHSADLATEIEIRRYKWTVRGLDPELLERLEKLLRSEIG
ncbi:MAG: hypothetical protein ABIK51_02730 [candidate division WOR-3 bacterium]